MTSRRDFLKATLASATVVAAPVPLRAENPQRGLPRPDPKGFESGDFLWPKKPGAYVPYNAGSANDPEADRKEWIRERDEYIRTASTEQLTPLDRKRIELLKKLEYREFLAIYEGAQTPGLPGVYSGSGVYVGHVGIVEVVGGVPYVIEALLKPGVVRNTYEQWLSGRPDQIIWHGRVKQLAAADRQKIAEEAKKYIGRPYKFWNFNLDDDKGFYCSKLVWLSVFRALNFAIDGNASAKRLIWFSPKQLLYLDTVDRLLDPGPYANA